MAHQFKPSDDQGDSPEIRRMREQLLEQLRREGERLSAGLDALSLELVKLNANGTPFNAHRAKSGDRETGQS